MKNSSGSAPVRTILVTGGAGYIGSHTTLELLQRGYRVVVVDNLDNSSEESLRRVGRLAGDGPPNLLFHKAHPFRFDAVIHFAGLKAVGESCRLPLSYYSTNISGTLTLLQTMAAHGCKQIVFSSSATVYGQPQSVPVREDAPLQALNPYGRTKLYVEHILRDLCASDASWRVMLLRYFNPVGAHPSGLIGEDPAGVPNNLMPFIQQVAVGRRGALTVFGNDYPTRDGTGVRDYIHVVDLAAGHVAALQRMAAEGGLGCATYNLGTGKGTSVTEMVEAFEKSTGVHIPLRFAERRAGDASEVFGDPSLARKDLGWSARLNIEDMCRDQWKWASANPWGYQNAENQNGGCKTQQTSQEPQPCAHPQAVGGKGGVEEEGESKSPTFTV